MDITLKYSTFAATYHGNWKNHKDCFAYGIAPAVVSEQKSAAGCTLAYLIERVGQLNDSTSAIVHEEPAVERKKPEVDNMRGFDPASEDDMDDNGMSRYMENNDDSGWE